jgi:SAM-dependent methyltransferase
MRGPAVVPANRSLAEIDHPTEDAFNRLAHVQLNNALAMAAREHATGRLVDIGCGLKPYAPLFADYVDEHVGVDHPDSPHALSSVDVLATAYEIPLADGSFDTALMSEMLEHLERPSDGLAEAHRLLRPGGKVILTTPFMWPLHEEPRDFFRYSPHGLRHLLEGAGFEEVAIAPLSGQWTTLALFAGYALRRSPAVRLGRLLPWYVQLQARIAVRLDERRLEPWFSWNHLAVGVKPERHAPIAGN